MKKGCGPLTAGEDHTVNKSKRKNMMIKDADFLQFQTGFSSIKFIFKLD
jgi:hypothetical protein